MITFDHITGAVIDDICVWLSHSRDNRSYTNMEKVITWLLLQPMADDCIKSRISCFRWTLIVFSYRKSLLISAIMV